MPNAADTPQGTLKGILELRWASESQFLYVPDKTDPLTYTNGARVVRPEVMSTDGGSIPRIFWPLKGLSPWAYGPAYALHDWLYNRHRCHKGDPQRDDCSFEEANAILDDAILILIQKGKASPHGEARHLIRWAVDKFGRSAWDGDCVPPPKLHPSEWLGIVSPHVVARFEF